MVRVLEVIYGFDYGGIRAFIMNSLEYIDKSKIQIDIYAFGTNESPYTEKVRALGANIYFNPENNVRKIFRFVKQLETFMVENGPYDVVHANCNLISAWVLLAAKRAGVSTRLSHSHSSSHFYGGIAQNTYSYIRQFIINKLSTTKLACGRLAGEAMYGEKAQFTIINNGIDVDKFLISNPKKIEELRRHLNIPDKVKVYASVTRLDTTKNHIFAVDVFREIHNMEPESIFLYGGVIPSIKPTDKIVRSRIEEYGLTEFTRFTGPIMDVENLYHLSDVWIYCSTSEGLPFGPIELQAAGVPCLASDVITNEIDLGLGLVEFMSLNNSPKEWAKKLISMKKNTIDIINIKTAFKDNNFDIKESVKKLEQIYLGHKRT